MSEAFDVLIVGGGPVGACLGALLAGTAASGARQMRIAVLEPHPAIPVPADAPLDPRVSALSRASERVLTHAGAWGRMAPKRCMPYERMRIWHESLPASSPDVLTFDAADVGEPNLGYIVENRLVQAAATGAFEQAGGHLLATELQGARVREADVQVETAAGVFSTRLLIGADGAHSAVRSAVGLTAESKSYRQSGIVARVATARSHERTAWQRFLGDGTLAFLPLADGTSSIVWSADEAVAGTLLAMPADEFQRELAAHLDHALGAVQLLSERASFALQRLLAPRYTTARCALVGDAAHVVHPLAGQGVNLGLLDAAALAERLLEAWRLGEDPGALRALRGYERWRKSEIALMALAIDGFDRFLSHGDGPISQLARRGLAWVNAAPQVKRFFIARALGLAGELPRTAVS